MATSVMNTSGHLQAQLTRSLDRVLEDASLSIELKLSGRKLKEFPKTGGKYNLNDTVVADLSKNRFSELPRDVTEFSSLEELGLYHNAIRSLPQSVSQLQSLTYLDLSRNQLTHLPTGLCSLPLKVLRVANNKLNALPLDLPRLGPTLEELDADCNEIASLPPHVGQLPALRSLRLRRNLLTYLPVEITYLRLVRLDISENRISSLPVELRKMTTLVTLELSDNPLISPPASRCTRGRVHIFKYLESQALKDDKRKGVVTLTPNDESKLRRHRKPGLFSDFRLANGIAAPYNGPEEWQKRYTADSGYNTSDGVDNKSWSSDVRLSSTSTEEDLDGGLTMGKIRADQSHTMKPGSLPVTNGGGVGASCFSGTSTPSTISPGESYMDLEEELAKVRMSESKDAAEEVVENGRRRKGSGAGSFQEGSGKRTVGHVRFNSNGSNGINGDSPEHFASGMQASNLTDSSDPLRNNQEGKKCLEHIQTYREYKEALRQQRGQDSLSIYRPRGNSTVDGLQTPGSPVTSGYSNDTFRMENQPLDDNRLNSVQSAENSSPLHKRAGPGDGENGQRLGRGDASIDQTAVYTVKSARNGSLPSNASTNGNGTMPSPPASMVNGGPQMHTHSPQHISKKAPNGAASPPPYAPPPSILSPSHCSSLQGENGTKRPSALTNAGPRLVTTSVGYLGASQQTRSSLQWPPPPQPPSPSSPSSGNAAPPGDPGGATTTGDPMVRCRGGRVASVKQQLFWNRDVSPHKLTFTMRREFEKAKEEAELIDRMRTSIETRLKMTLPEELSPALSDGVVLCHLANHVRPHSVLSIHVPSPAVPKLTMARCRRNVDNFLEACRKIGVEEKYLCSCEDVIGLGDDPSSNSGVLKGNLLAVLDTVRHLLSVSPQTPHSAHQNGSSTICGEDDLLDDGNVDNLKQSLRGNNRLWDSFVTFLCISVFISTIVLLYYFPPPD